MLTYFGQAIPQITDEFNSLPDVGWYGSAYLLTCCSFQLLLGKLYTFYAVKAVLLMSVLLFEVSSVVCGAAPSSMAFIVGRAIAGIGAAGIFAGAVSYPTTTSSLISIIGLNGLTRASRLCALSMLFLWKNVRDCKASSAPSLALLRL